MTDSYNPHRTTYIASVVALGGLLFGFDASVISGVIGFVVPEMSLDEFELGLLVTAPSLGGLLSGLAAGPLSDYIGRKRVLLILAGLYTVSAVGSALAPNYETLLVARALGGVAFASLGIAPMYIAEIAPYEKRGMLVSFNQFNIVLGFSVAYFTNYYVLQLSQSDAAWVSQLGIDSSTWRWMFGLEILPAALWFFALLAVPETPRWLATNHRVEAARTVLSTIRPANRVDVTLQNISDAAANVERPFRERLGEVLGPKMRLALGIAIIVGVFQQITGINAVFFYAPTVFEQSGVGTNAAFAQAALVGVINVIFTVLAMLLIDRLGRKPLLIIGLLGIAFSISLTAYGFSQARYELTTEAVTNLPTEIDQARLSAVVDVRFDNDLDFKKAIAEALGSQDARNHQAALVAAAIEINPKLVLIGILGFVASFAMSLGPVMWVLFSEIFPNRVRGIALAIAMVFNSASASLVQFIFPWELANLGNAMTFYLYAALALIGVILIQWLLPETKGRSLEELEAVLSR